MDIKGSVCPDSNVPVLNLVFVFGDMDKVMHLWKSHEHDFP